MRLSDDDESRVEDRRGVGGGGGFGRPGVKVGLGTVVILGVLSVVFKQNFFALLDGGPAPAPTSQMQDDPGRRAREEPLKRVAVRAFNDAQRELGAMVGPRYRPATLVLFWDEVFSDGCGGATADTGPFYCPADEKVYIDLGFYDELSRRFGAPGDFAQAYVMAHEMGHHIQRVLGLRGIGADANERLTKNARSVRVELQADCLAGVWGATAARRKLLDAGDIDEGLRAAAAIGDDRLQRMAGRRVSPESFTHGSSADRVRAFRTGFDGGRLEACLR
jgi:hypothetical protein